VAEAGVVVEIQAETRGIDEYELAPGPELQLAFLFEQGLGYGGQVIKGPDYCCILYRIQLDGSHRPVKREDEGATGAANRGVRPRLVPVGIVALAALRRCEAEG
jgi:hypothetical protein